MWPDVEALIMDLIGARFGDPTHVGNTAPADLQTRLPYARVLALGGTDDWVTDTAAIDVDVFAANRSQSMRLAMQCRADLLGSVHTIPTGLLDHCYTRVRPRRLPWPDERIVLIGATYDVTTRRTT